MRHNQAGKRAGALLSLTSVVCMLVSSGLCGEPDVAEMLSLTDRGFFLSALARIERDVPAPVEDSYVYRVKPIAFIEKADDLRATDAEFLCERTRVRKIVRESQRLSLSGRHDDAARLLIKTRDSVRTEKARSVLTGQIGCVRFEKGDYEAAGRSVDEYDALNPLSAIGRCNRAAISMFLGEYDEALRQLEPIQIELIENPKFKWAVHYNLACANSLKGRINPAIDHFIEAYIIDSQATVENVNDPHLANIRGHERVRDTVVGVLQDAQKKEIHAGYLRLERTQGTDEDMRFAERGGGL
ncbi:MAG: hypothetical protein KJ626_12990 [Verrucomicrobia bacterium]|nr:hypothetical protein [Verrucomicrobiota bacterium]